MNSRCARQSIAVAMICVGWSICLQPSAHAQTMPSSAIDPLLDDAGLNDVQFVGMQYGWAVGERGVAWRTNDGGESWQLVPTPVRCSLRSVCFLTDKIGWIAGGAIDPYTRINNGVLLKTDDGGVSWQVLAGVNDRQRSPDDSAADEMARRTPGLPQLHYIRFFGPRAGVAVGGSSSKFPTGVMMTDDGGQSWIAVAGDRVDGWQTASFTTAPDVGSVAGLRNSLSVVGAGKLMRPSYQRTGLRGFRDMTIGTNDTGWLVGDGGLVLRTDNGGVSWTDPPEVLPNGVRDFVDFKAVAQVDRSVWIAGEPGSVVWHSPDAGRTWIRQPTGQTAPIRALHFESSSTGWAVGDFGMMLRTDDGGITWRTQRAGNRRAAALLVAAHADRVPIDVLAKHSAELGYRSAAIVSVRRDRGPGGFDHRDLESRVQDAIVRSGGNIGQVDWRFPIDKPGLDRRRDRLVAEWRKRSEGRLEQVLVGRFVGLIRTWRPSVVVINDARDGDATADVINSAVLQAVEYAGDASRFPEQRKLAALPPWRVDRVFQRLPPGSDGSVLIEPFELLPRIGTSNNQATIASRHLLSDSIAVSATPTAWAMIRPDRDGQSTTGGSEMFAGLRISQGSDARRQLRPVDDRQLSERLEVARRQRNFQSYVDRMAAEPEVAAQLIGELRNLARGMSEEAAALQLVQLAEKYAGRNQWELVEATRYELVNRFPDQSLAAESMVWLYHWYSGAEPVWHRTVTTQASARQDQFDVRNADDVRTEGSVPDVAIRSRGNEGQIIRIEARSRGGKWSDLRREEQDEWQQRSRRVASLLREHHPALFESSRVQFPIAAQLRAKGAIGPANAVYSRVAGSGDDWKAVAESEIRATNPSGLSPDFLLSCVTAIERPYLDGVLSDGCWQRAREARLQREGDDNIDNESHAFVLMARDAEYLYIAASVPRDPSTEYLPEKRAGRQHDDDLAAFDRLTLAIDVDRDYATWYEFSIDQRGCTADRCWQDESWNPQWHVASALEATHWRIELAIPFRELVETPPRHRTMWAIGIARTIPAIGAESWTQPVAAPPRPSSFGLLQFD